MIKIHKLTQIVLWYSDLSIQNEFHQEAQFESHYICDLFSRKLQNNDFKIEKIGKVSIILKLNLNPVTNKELFISGIGVFMFESTFNLVNSSYEKAKSSKYEALKIIYNSFIKISDHYKLDTSKIHKAYNDCLEVDIINEYFIAEPKYSKDKKAYAHIFCKHEAKNYSVFLNVYNSESKEIINSICITNKGGAAYYCRDYFVPIRGGVNSFYIQPKGGKEKIEIGF